ncbi:MAG TPA: DUF2325 domain-containing protein [Hyphomicrobiaceae bacterium]|jgi:hypothetical protein
MTADGTGFEAVGLLDPASEEAQRRPRKRWRLWDLHRGIHGALLALSFTDDEFRRLLRRARVGIPAEARYYDIHRHLCDACTTRNALSELIEKALDQKFATKIVALRGTRTGEALEAKWQEAWSKGRGLAALFWPFLSHPCATDEIRAGFYADVHALFYRALSERERLLEKVENLEHRCRALEKRHREELSALEQRLERALRPKVIDATSSSDSDAIATLQIRFASATQRAARAEARVRTLEERLRHRRNQARKVKWSVAPEPNGAGTLSKDYEAASGSDDGDAETDLQIPGVRLAYVGGRPGSRERIREFCEKRGATLIDHDGGLEESPVRLDQLLERADVVFYPVDCISHEAAQHLKSHCKRAEKPFIPLRNSSISEFRRALKSWCGVS